VTLTWWQQRGAGARVGAVGIVLLMTLSAGGCGAISGHGSEKAVFKIPPADRIAVLVDAAGSSGADIDVPSSLEKALGEHLFTYKVSTEIVNSDRTDNLRRAGDLKDISIASFAAKVDAKLVLYVRLTQFRVEPVGDTGYYQGLSSATARLIDASGKKLWPIAGDEPDFEADVQEDKTLGHDDVKKYLIDLLAVRIGRTFHDYSKDDPYVSR
jgi:hypothetical protein